MSRRVASWTLVVLAALLALSGALASWASSMADSERFADLATEALQQEDVSHLLAERLVDRFASDTALGTSGRPFAVGVTEDIISSDEFAGVFNTSVRTAHEQLVSDRDDSVTVALAGAAPVLDPALDPDDTSDPPSEAESVVALVDDPVLVRISNVLSVMDTVALLCAVGWLGLSAVVLVIASDRRRALRRLGSGLLVTGVVLITAVVMLAPSSGGANPPTRTPRRQPWSRSSQARCCCSPRCSRSSARSSQCALSAPLRQSASSPR